MITCPLCQNTQNFSSLKGPDKRDYNCCTNCKLIFVDEQNLLPLNEERDRYLEHNNGIEHPGYVNFLNQAVEPALNYITPGMSGLDYGCGPGPALHLLLQRRGFECEIYDPHFFPELPPGRFDFIFATEAFEHFYSPRKELITINEKLQPGGFLIIMTVKWEFTEKFAEWYYPNDITHVCFYNDHTFTWISEKFGFIRRESNNSRVTILQKKNT